MNFILNNPYRILGLLVGATAREQERQVNRLKQFIEAEQIPESDFSFPSLGHLHRTIESVTDAASKLNLDSDKMNAALFWFYKGNPTTDEPAIDALKASDFNQAQNIWEKLTSNPEVTQRNASAYNNLGTLYLSGILEGQNTNEALLEKSISLKLKFLESDIVKDFKALATDETFKTTKIKLQLLFLNQLQTDVEKNKYVSLSQFLTILTQQEFSAKEDFLKGFVQKPIEQIEKKIEDAKAKRKANVANALNIGKNLIEETSESLNQVRSIVGESNFKFSSISDKVSEEILQCGVDYFKFHKDKTLSSQYKTLGDDVLNIFNTASLIVVGNIVKQRCQENIEFLKEWKEIDKQIQFQNNCWFCSKNIADDEAVLKTNLYKETYRSPFYEKKREVRYETISVNISRCKDCQVIHTKKSDIADRIFLISFIITFIISLIFVFTKEHIFWSIIGSVIIASISTIIIVPFSNLIVNYFNSKKHKIKDESNIESHPAIHKLIYSGWSFVKPSID